MNRKVAKRRIMGSESKSKLSRNYSEKVVDACLMIIIFIILVGLVLSYIENGG